MPSKAFTDFQLKLADLEAARDRFEIMTSSSAGASGDILLAYEGLFLRLIVAFENYLERYLAELLDGTHVPTMVGFVTQVKFQTPDVREAVVLNLKDYKIWLPFEKTLDIAKLYLKDGIPFSLASADQRNQVKTLLIIRHAIAHSSDHAQKRFRDQVIGSAKLPANETNPAGFLRGLFRSTPRSTRLELYVQHLLKLAQTIDL